MRQWSSTLEASMHRHLAIITLLLAQSALAETPVDLPKAISEHFDDRLATEALYDCTATPSHLIVQTIDVLDDPFKAEVFIGAKSDCEPQAKELRRFRDSFRVPGTIAICAGTPVFLHRFVVQPAVLSWSHAIKAGRVVKMRPQIYAGMAECREYAKRLNGAAQPF